MALTFNSGGALIGGLCCDIPGCVEHPHEEVAAVGAIAGEVENAAQKLEEPGGMPLS